MPNKKINALDVRVAVASDLMLVGDPATGTAYKSTLATLPIVPTSRTLTINGVAFDLSANRSWTIAAGVSSVGLSMPSAFTVGSSPITSSGTLAVTGAGTTLQYIDGTGALQTLPTRLESDSLVAVVRNQSGATMTKGTVVYISGATGNKPLISKALATGDATSAQTLGLLQTDIANNADGHIVIIGNVTDLNTSALTEGQQLYLSGTTAGTYTSTKPYAPIHLVYVAIVIRSHPTQGTLSVKIQNGFEMDELHNVSAQSPANNDGLFWNATTSLWSKNTIAGVLGYTPVTSARNIATTSPLVGGGDLSADRTLSIPAATTSVNGYLTSTDWTTFNAKQASLTLTTTGTSGAATLVGATLNIPQYSGGGSMAIGGSITSATAGSVLFAGTSGVLQQDNANFFWDDTNNRLGIGTATPSAIFHSVGSINAASAIGRGNYLQPTIVANTNGDVLVGLDINPTFTNGSVSNVINNSVRITAPLQGGYPALSILQPTNTTTSWLSIRNSNTYGAGVVAAEFGVCGTSGSFFSTTAQGDVAFKAYSGSNTSKFFIGAGSGSNPHIVLFPSTTNVCINSTTDAGYRLDVNGTARVVGQTTLTGSVTATSALAQGIIATPTLVAAANSDTTVGLDITPVFTNGAFTSVNNIALRVTANVTTGYGIYQAGANASNYFAGATTFNSNLTCNAIIRGASFEDSSGFGTKLAQNFLNLYSSTAVLTANGVTGGLSLHNSGLVDTSVGAGVLFSINSVTRGFRVPRMTTIQKNAVASPTAGIIVFDTTLNKLCVYTTAWETITSI